MESSTSLPSPIESNSSEGTLDSGLSNAKSSTLFGDDHSEPPPSPTDSDYQDTYTVFVVQHGGASEPSMNWELAIRTCMTSEFGRREAFGNVYRLDGSTGEYCYEKKEGVRYELSATFSESTEVSKFSSEILGRVEEIIQGVDIRNDDPDYDTRTWVFDVVHALRAEGIYEEDNQDLQRSGEEINDPSDEED